MLSAKKRINLLFFFNLILLGASWLMACYAYPRLPTKMPLWINFMGQESIDAEKSLLFFIYVAFQTFLVVGFPALVRIKHRMEKARLSVLVQDLQKEIILLVLIFFQLIFIHIQRSLILMAHGVEKGIRPYYFYSVIGIILILIPYYRMRLKLLRKRWMMRD